MRDTDTVPTSVRDFAVGDIWKDWRGNEWLITGFKPQSRKYPLTGRKRGPNGQFGKGAYKLQVMAFREKVGHDDELLNEIASMMICISQADADELCALLTTADHTFPWQRRILSAIATAKVH